LTTVTIKLQLAYYNHYKNKIFVFMKKKENKR